MCGFPRGEANAGEEAAQEADLTIKGAKAVEFFWWLFDLSRRVFEGGPFEQQFACLPRPSMVEERHVNEERVKQEYDDRVAAVTTRDDEDDDCSVDWGGRDDEDDDLGDTGSDLAKDTPDDAGAGSAPPPGAGGCAPPLAELKLDRLPRAAREAKDTPDDAGGGSAPPPGAGGCAPPPAEGEESVLDRLRRAAREAKDGLPVYTQDTIEEAAGGALRPAPPELMQEMRRHRVIFCTVCFGRGWQVRRALPATLLRLWPYREVAKVMLILAGPEYDGGPAHPDLEWLKYHCQGALHTGLLQVHIAAMPHWHASVGKNSAHRVACEYAWHAWGDAANPVLVTLDCDNIIGSNYMMHIATFMQQSRESDNYECSMGCVGLGNQGVTGRNACFMRAFLNVRGYDEAMLPMGSQDVDLLERLNAAAQPHNISRAIKGKPDCGVSIPNDLMDRDNAWGRSDGQERGAAVCRNVVDAHERPQRIVRFEAAI